MKDLKHLIYFEDLLQNAHNALIEQAQTLWARVDQYMNEKLEETEVL